jgi:hypothetical protein
VEEAIVVVIGNTMLLNGTPPASVATAPTRSQTLKMMVFKN